MTLQQFKTAKIIIAVTLGIIIGQSVANNNYIVPLMATAVSAIVIYFIRQKVKEVVADERDYEIGGKAARTAMTVFSWIAVIIMFIFYSMRDISPVYEAIALTLSYSVCFLLIIYSLIFKYYYKK
jgi:uncharacterized membrane protein